MSEPTYEIVFRGKILKDFDRATVRRNLAQLFRTDEARIEAMLDAPKVVLKRGLAKEAGQRMQEVLRQAGIMVALLPEGGVVAGTGAAPPVTVAPPAPAPPTAPPVPVTTAPVAPVATAGDSGLTLAEVGALVLENVHKPRSRSYDLSGLKLAATGEPLVTVPKAGPRQFDTSLLELAPIEEQPEAAPSALTRELYS